ncbi:CBS domain-containing protein [Erysipelothrix sp. strain 2 (EsS2-7-Brazil)]|uniref:CBS domain-containing protein n=1 Tax=Erysipelothrix sp. strain 2 (EsS2-7-Brazil) TaxID=2500579 RepID=UPI001909AE19|nr:CBS domain-containing protein [Erysipelothrix sp. strain 2 (EsS2-7-Brazil)]MBK2403277.1 CBS domain-containing protein [Erysipelothrix sp. strain 2 (EsS2-7-Brazil)]
MTTLNNINSKHLNEAPYTSIAFLLKPKGLIGYITNTASVRQALEKMKFHGYTAMPVITEDGQFYGTINEGDFLWYLIHEKITDMKDVEEVYLKDIMRHSWNPPVTIDVDLSYVLERILDQNFVPVVDDRNKFMGIITRKSVLMYYQDMKQG